MKAPRLMHQGASSWCALTIGMVLIVNPTPGTSETSAGILSERYTCVMDPAKSIELATQSSGVLSEVLIVRGQAVAAGEKIAQTNSLLEAATLQILETRAQSTEQIVAQEARLAFVEAQLDRVRRLVEQNAQSAVRLEELEYEFLLAKSQLHQAQNEHLALRAEVERAKVALLNTEVRSPISGVVTDVLLSAGEYAGADRPIAKIVQLDPLYIEAFLPIDLYDQIRVGELVKITADPPIQYAGSAKVIAKDPVFDSASRTFGIRAEIPNEGNLLPAGHRCQLSFER